MIEQDNILLVTFQSRIEKFKKLCDKLTNEKKQLATIIEKKEAEIAQLRKEKEELQSSYDYLKKARIMSLHTDDLYAAKKEVAGLVRDVDKCISLLKK